MAYATADDVRAVLMPTDDVLATPGDLDDVKLDAAVQSASAQVNSKLALRYAVPFPDPCPDLVHEIVVAVAAWLAQLTWRRDVDVTERDPQQLRYQWAVALLADLASGAADLPGADPGQDGPAERRGVVAVQPGVGRVFGLRDFGLRRDYCGGVESDWFGRGGGW